MAAALPTDSAAAPRHPRGYVVDSAISTDEALRRFRVGLAPVAHLAGGAPSREALVRAFVRALERGDTAALRRMEISRGEFAYLFYPSSIYTHPPFEQSPEIVWMLQRAQGGSGYARLVARYAGRSLAYRGLSCPNEPAAQGANRLWGDCVIRYTRTQGDTATGRLFGVILERDGRFKFVNYANDF